jgi:hypothetical protein
MERVAKSLRRLRDANQRSSQIALNVHCEGLDWRNVKDAASLRIRRNRAEHDAINAPQECRESFAGARRSENQRRFAARNGGPAFDLRARGLGKYGFKPIANCGMEKFKRIAICADRGFDFLRHLDS